MAVSSFEDVTNRLVDWWNAARALVETGGDLASVVPMVCRSHLDTVVLVGRPNKFTPTNDLPDKSFERIERYFVLLRESQSFFYDLLWCQKTYVKRRSQHAVPEP